MILSGTPSLVKGNAKQILGSDGSLEIYDLERDFMETCNVFEPSVGAENPADSDLTERQTDWVFENVTQSKLELDPAVRDGLRELGYLR